MSLPNILTNLRIILTVVFLLLIFQDGMVSIILAIIIFAVASLTDYYDGYLSRKYNLVTNFGKIMDPIADKFLMLSCFYAFYIMNIISLWMFVVIFIREIVVTGYRFYMMKNGRVLAAEKLGKYKTISQIVAISVILLFIFMLELGEYLAVFEKISFYWNMLIGPLMIFTVILTLISGFSVLKNNIKVRI